MFRQIHVVDSRGSRRFSLVKLQMTVFQFGPCRTPNFRSIASKTQKAFESNFNPLAKITFCLKILTQPEKRPFVEIGVVDLVDLVALVLEDGEHELSNSKSCSKCRIIFISSTFCRFLCSSNFLKSSGDNAPGGGFRFGMPKQR